MELRRSDNLVVAWVGWHFYEMPKFLFGIWKNYLWFGMNYFSIPLLLSTLLSPWRRYRWNYPRGFNIGEYASIFVTNVFSRIIGAVCRLALIGIGAVSQLGIFLFGIIIQIAWLLLPFAIAALIFFSVYEYRI